MDENGLPPGIAVFLALIGLVLILAMATVVIPMAESVF